jgi:flagellar biogenesis protein FliO
MRNAALLILAAALLAPAAAHAALNVVKNETRVQAKELVPAAPAESQAPAYLSGPLRDEQAPSSGKVNLAAAVARALLGLAVVIGLIFVCARLSKGLMQGGTGSAPAGRLINVVECGYLSPKHRLYIVDAAGELLLVSCDQSGTRLVSRLDSESARAAAGQARAAAGQKSFGSVLSGLMKGFRNDDAPAQPGTAAQIRDIHAEVEKLKAMRNELPS